MAKSTGPEVVYQLKITLVGSKPPIWRRVLVKDCTLRKLHDVIQESMGWEDSHLHMFQVAGVNYGQPHPDWGIQVRDEARIHLSQIAATGLKKIDYQYDMGDSWDHTIQIEKVLEPEPGTRYPRCVAGKRACPPEDCGGVWGYADFLEAISDPKHPNHGEMLEWIGGEFDPEKFDIEAVNARLR